MINVSPFWHGLCRDADRRGARRANQFPQHGEQEPESHAAVFSDTNNDVKGALLRMGAVIAVIGALAGSFALLGA